ncbi:hypothetical protein [Spiroplasma floricola]|uniref:Uncharacterized protein n=1 Tax=Spiroplasma floricola 23-6 TaxID=1336749 RepID=A0A2K8SCT8_9MOLU|nr:hypothetical protein [Spiroplasma floricola]AUB31262.1 hypothetical protein SFLOR_v1c02010 [Spiroplasma floricola 23-6]
MKMKTLPKFNIISFEVAYLFEFQKWIHVFCNKKIMDINEFCSKCSKSFKSFNSNNILFFNNVNNYNDDTNILFEDTNTLLNLKSYINGSATKEYSFLYFKSNSVFNLLEDNKFLRIFYNEFEIEIKVYRNNFIEYFWFCNYYNNFIINKLNLVFYKYNFTKTLSFDYNQKKWFINKDNYIKKHNLIYFFELLTNNIFELNKNIFLFNKEINKNYLEFLENVRNSFLKLIEYKINKNEIINTEMLNFYLYKKIIKTKKDFEINFENYRNLFYLLKYFKISVILNAWDINIINNFGLNKLWQLIFLGKNFYKKLTRAELKKLDQLTNKYYINNNLFSYKLYLTLIIFISYSGDINKINKEINCLKNLNINFLNNKFLFKNQINKENQKIALWFLKYLINLSKEYKILFYKFIFRWLKDKLNTSYDLFNLISKLKKIKNLKTHNFIECNFCKNKNVKISDLLLHLNNLNLEKINLTELKISTNLFNFELITTYSKFELVSLELKNCLKTNYTNNFSEYKKNLFFSILDKNFNLIGAVYIEKIKKEWVLREANSKQNKGFSNNFFKDIKVNFLTKINKTLNNLVIEGK